MQRLVQKLAGGVLLSTLAIACTMHQTNQLPSDENGGGGPAAQQPAQQGSGSSQSSSSGDDASTSSDADLVPVTPKADANPPAPTGPAVTSFTLIDSDTDQPVANYDPIPEGSTLTLADLPTNLNVRANTTAPSGTTIGSVAFDFDGTTNFHIEGAAPYALASDNAGDYNPLTPPLTATAHTLTATPYSDVNATGTAGTGKTLHFTAQ